MYLEIVSPEATLFAGEVNSVTVPGINGEFQMLQITHLSFLYCKKVLLKFKVTM